MECRIYYPNNTESSKKNHQPPIPTQVTIETSRLRLCRARSYVLIISPLHEYHHKDLPQTHTASPSLLVVIERFNPSSNHHYLFHEQQVILKKQMQVFNVAKTRSCLVHLFLYLVIAAEQYIRKSQDRLAIEQSEQSQSDTIKRYKSS